MGDDLERWLTLAAGLLAVLKLNDLLALVWGRRKASAEGRKAEAEADQAQLTTASKLAEVYRQLPVDLRQFSGGREADQAQLTTASKLAEVYRQLTDLQEKVCYLGEQLEKERARADQLEARVIALEAENGRLRAENTELRTAIARNGRARL